IDKGDVNVKIIGSDMTPLVTGQVDVVSGWVINVGTLSVLPEDYVTAMLSDLGIRLYAYPYYTTEDMLDSSADQLAGFITATGKGWEWARRNLDESIDMLIKRVPELRRAEQKQGAERIMQYMWTEETAERGWGTMTADSWESQIQTWDSLDQFGGEAPTVDDVMTTSVLEATKGDRPETGPA
ncbi:MAG: ABC transporter substrate-binding protein, partial [Actinomycetia bacterium]|nr:ABC transporter substrate-binding protein [Actinomycetes bacterium]